MSQMLELFNKDFKEATIKKAFNKKLQMKISNLCQQVEIVKKNQVQITELKNTVPK